MRLRRHRVCMRRLVPPAAVLPRSRSLRQIRTSQRLLRAPGANKKTRPDWGESVSRYHPTSHARPPGRAASRPITGMPARAYPGSPAQRMSLRNHTPRFPSSAPTLPTRCGGHAGYHSFIDSVRFSIAAAFGHGAGCPICAQISSLFHYSRAATDCQMHARPLGNSGFTRLRDENSA
jgi:hypothetical protein